MKINGKPSEISASAGSYLTVVRTWNEGDVIEIEMPMQLHVESMPDDHSMQADLYGPLLLAGELGETGLTPELAIGQMGPDLKKHPAEGVPPLRAAGGTIVSSIKNGDRPLAFQTVGQQTGFALTPFYRVSGQRYSVYWKFS